jgi:Trk-type K+ transport system membrane component
MFAGGGSGSVAGGIKVSTLALLVFIVLAEIRGEAEVNAFRRRIPEAVQRQALTVAAVSINIIVLGALVILATNDLPFADVVFEVTAAFTTAGLSTGITGELNGLGHAVLMVLMFLGRVGPLTLGVALVLRERDRRYSHPDERPLVG